MTIEKLRFKKNGASDVVVEGKATPGAEVVVENKSLAPFAPTKTTDVFARAKVAPDGSFSVAVPAGREGDRLQVKAGGSTVNVRLHDVEGFDGRPPVVRQQGLRLVDDGDGFVHFEQVCKNDVIGEPQQVLQLKNRRTHVAAHITLDDEGRIPAGTRLEAKPGDTFQLSTTDGAHNKKLTEGCGLLVVPRPDAEPASSTEAGSVELRPVSLPLFADGSPRSCTVKQGSLGDCWLVSAVDAIAARKPERLRDMIKDHGDGTFTVTFRRWDHQRGRYVAAPVTVTNQLYVKGDGRTPVFGSSTERDLWFPILEKAYAKWKGGYEGVRSGYPFEAFEALLGAEGKYFDLDVTDIDALWTALTERQRRGEVIAAWTRLESRSLHFSNTGLTQDHAYAVLGVEEVDGRRMVRLRNPWGSNSWAPPINKLGIRLEKDGVVVVPVRVFAERFVGVGSAPA